MQWLDVFHAAHHGHRADGYYHDNVRVDTPVGPVIVRRPKPGAMAMDMRLWPEASILTALDGVAQNVPRVLHVSDVPQFQVHEFVRGDVLDGICPRGSPVPGHLIDDVVRLVGQTTGLSPRTSPELVPPMGWPADGDTVGFARRLCAFTAGVYERYVVSYGALYTALGVPDDPTAFVRRRWSGLTERPFAVIHCDLHRKNMIVDGARTVFLDWELALWGDPVYDLAVHLHKMSYLPAERDRLVEGWLTAVGPRRAAGWERDLEVYLAHERIRSVLNDSVRYAMGIGSGRLDVAQERTLIGKLVGKLDAAYRYWEPGRPTSAAQTEDVLRRWRMSGFERSST